MRQVTTIGLDIAKCVFQVHGVDAEGSGSPADQAPSGVGIFPEALANKIARMAWAIMAKGERYKEPAALAA